MIFMCRGAGKNGIGGINIAYIVGLIIVVFAIIYICFLLFYKPDDSNNFSLYKLQANNTA